MTNRLRWTYICSAFVVCVSGANRASAYDLSRQDPGPSVEAGFIYGNATLWLPGFGTFESAHQMSLDVGGEFGWRFVKIRGGEHNVYFVAGLDVSPQTLDPEYFRGEHYGSLLFWPSFGLRYQGLCIADGLGCPFLELRLGFAVESDDHHSGPSGDVTVFPGIGYRFKFGPLLLGARADVAFSEESRRRSLSWVTLSGLVGIGW